MYFQVIAVCNGGLCNGITHEMVTEVFNKYCGMESVFMASGKSYCFVTFHDFITAEKAYHAINGETIWSKIKGPIFLGFVNEFNFKILQDQIIFKNPPGLILIDDFVTSKEEEFILNLIKFADGNEEEDTVEINYSSTLKHRKVKHYGYEFKYSTNNVDLSEPIEQIPQELDFLWERLRNASSENQNYIDFVPDQLTINCYEPGQGIPPHVDTHSAFEDGILSLSLQSSIVMEFKNESNISWNVILKRRSLCIMLGESRFVEYKIKFKYYNAQTFEEELLFLLGMIGPMV